MTDEATKGVERAIDWIRGMGPREIAIGAFDAKVDEEVYRRVAASIARYLVIRVDASDRPTMPSLPPSSE